MAELSDEVELLPVVSYPVKLKVGGNKDTPITKYDRSVQEACFILGLLGGRTELYIFAHCLFLGLLLNHFKQRSFYDRAAYSL